MKRVEMALEAYAVLRQMRYSFHNVGPEIRHTF
jgi:hypothetical protein